MIRSLLAALAGSAVAASAAAQTPRPLETPEPRAVAAGVWLIPGGMVPGRQPDGNTIVFAAGRGLVVMDTGRHPVQREAITAFARARGAPVTAIVNSHWHLDHVSGNPDLRAAFPGLRVYASRAIDQALTGFLPASAADGRTHLSDKLPPETIEDLQRDLATIEHGAALKPDVYVERSQAVRFGPLSLRLNLAPDAATAGDLWVWDAKARVVASGDLVTLPAAFLDTACADGWRAALAGIDATPFETLIPGHGAPMTHPEFAAYRQAFEALVDCSAGTATPAQCADAWAKDLGALLPPDQSRMGLGMTRYYVAEVLRKNGGKSAACKAGKG